MAWEHLNIIDGDGVQYDIGVVEWMIIRKIDSVMNDDRTVTITIKIDGSNEYKFMRWLDLMNAYDSYRKNKASIKSLKKEIISDYDKDFREEDDDW